MSRTEKSGGRTRLVVLAVLVLLGVVAGYTIYQHFLGAPAACRGGDAWILATERRYHDTLSRQAALSPDASTLTEFQEAATLIKQYSIQQLRSSPPEAGRALNAAMAQFFLYLGLNYEAIAQHAPAQFSEEEMAASAAKIPRLLEEYHTTCGPQ